MAGMGAGRPGLSQAATKGSAEATASSRGSPTGESSSKLLRKWLQDSFLPRHWARVWVPPWPPGRGASPQGSSRHGSLLGSEQTSRTHAQVAAAP